MGRHDQPNKKTRNEKLKTIPNFEFPGVVGEDESFGGDFSNIPGPATAPTGIIARCM
jgi:hypothetical protein